MRAPCNVGEGLVDGDAFDRRREIAQDSDGGVAEPLVFVVMAADKHEVGTELPRAPSRHAASYAEGPRFVGGREDVGKLANLHPRILAIKLDGATKEEFVWGFRTGFITFADGNSFENARVMTALEKK